MKRDAISLQQVAAHSNLVLATWKAARGKLQRPEVARFLSDVDARLASLGAAILAGLAPRGEQRQFIIHDPKRRLITAACFEDRVLHHAILNLAEPRFERMLVQGCYACRPGKGVHAAVLAVQRHLHQAQAWPWFARRRLDQQRQQRPLGPAQLQPPGQREPQHRVPSLPELDGRRGVDAPRCMDQTRRPARRGPGCGFGRARVAAGKPQGTRGAGRPGSGCARPNALRAAAFDLGLACLACWHG